MAKVRAVELGNLELMEQFRNKGILMDFEVMPRLWEWGSWNRRGEANRLGYPSITVEGRIKAGEPLSSEAVGRYRVPSDLVPEAIERAVAWLFAAHPPEALVLRARFVDRLSHRAASVWLSRQLGVHVGLRTIQRLEDRAIAWVDARFPVEFDG
jgi:hypothetical protein